MVKFKDFSRPLSVIPVLFKANLIFKDFSRQSCIFKYFSSLCEPCIGINKEVRDCIGKSRTRVNILFINQNI